MCDALVLHVGDLREGVTVKMMEDEAMTSETGEKTLLERGYDLLDDVQELLSLLRSGRIDLKELAGLQQRLAAIAASLPPVENGGNTADGAQEPLKQEQNEEKAALKAELAAKNAEMKQLIDALRRFQQDYGLLFSSSETVQASSPYKRE